MLAVNTPQSLIAKILLCLLVLGAGVSESMAAVECSDRWGGHYVLTNPPQNRVDGVVCSPLRGQAAPPVAAPTRLVPPPARVSSVVPISAKPTRSAEFDFSPIYAQKPAPRVKEEPSLREAWAARTPRRVYYVAGTLPVHAAHPEAAVSVAAPGAIEAMLRQAPTAAGVPSPRLQSLAGPAADAPAGRRRGAPSTGEFDAMIESTARTYGHDANLLRAIIHMESRGNPNAISPKGAIGLMQVMPATAAGLGLQQPRRTLLEPATNIRTGARYLRQLLNTFPGRPELAIAAYNAGEMSVRRYKHNIPPYPETQAYVRGVLAHYRQLNKQM